jgi:hypothetical protein
VLSHWDERRLSDVLAANGLTGVAEGPFANDGWSGASLTRLVRPTDGTAFILKRSSWAADWIARSTRDHALREGFIAAMPLPLPEPLVAPYHGAGAEGTAVGILMPDLSDRLSGWDLGATPADPRDLQRILDALARLHAAPWPISETHAPGHDWPTHPLRAPAAARATVRRATRRGRRRRRPAVRERLGRLRSACATAGQGPRGPPDTDPRRSLRHLPACRRRVSTAT